MAAESRRIVESFAARGCEVDYLLFEDEGRGFLKRGNEFRALRATAAWLERHVKAE